MTKQRNKKYDCNENSFITSNWIVCKDWTWLNKWYIDNETDIAKIRLCTNITQWNSCGISDEICTYTSEDELRYIVLY